MYVSPVAISSHVPLFPPGGGTGTMGGFSGVQRGEGGGSQERSKGLKEDVIPDVRSVCAYKYSNFCSRAAPGRRNKGLCCDFMRAMNQSLGAILGFDRYRTGIGEIESSNHLQFVLRT